MTESDAIAAMRADMSSEIAQLENTLHVELAERDVKIEALKEEVSRLQSAEAGREGRSRQNL